jgi:hypothetical protein
MRLLQLIPATTIFWLISAFSFAQDSFPNVETETINGETVMVPESFSGNFVFIGVGTGKKAEDELRTWQIPVYNKFIAKTGLMDGMYDVKVCFLPLFTGAMKLAKNDVIRKLKENNESLILDHVYVYSGDRGPFEEIGIDDKKTPYFFLLNRDGKIVWEGKGSFKQSYFDRIDEILSQ